MHKNQYHMGANQSPVPLYQQVKNYIESRIQEGTFRPDERIPSENELVALLGISRMTINRALRELTADGKLVRTQGVGTFVARPKAQSALVDIKSIAQEIRERGGRHSCRVFLLREETAEPDMAAAMGLDQGARVFHSILVHRDGDVAMQLAERFVNPKLAPDYLKQDFTRITPAEYLLAVAPVSEAEHVIEAVLPDDQARQLLAIGKYEPCLVLYRKIWAGNCLATSNRFVYPGSRYRIGGRFSPATVTPDPATIG
ncbi:MAG: histidine utilization repressor [Desulfobacteraceae bacterium]|nr:histidine utilization repressor [Desulfobacteraceae bacterium]